MIFDLQKVAGVFVPHLHSQAIIASVSLTNPFRSYATEIFRTNADFILIR